MWRWLGDNWGWVFFGVVPMTYFVGQGAVESIRRHERMRVTGEYESPPDNGTDYWT